MGGNRSSRDTVELQPRDTRQSCRWQDLIVGTSLPGRSWFALAVLDAPWWPLTSNAMRSRKVLGARVGVCFGKNATALDSVRPILGAHVGAAKHVIGCLTYACGRNFGEETIKAGHFFGEILEKEASLGKSKLDSDRSLKCSSRLIAQPLLLLCFSSRFTCDIINLQCYPHGYLVSSQDDPSWLSTHACTVHERAR